MILSPNLKSNIVTKSYIIVSQPFLMVFPLWTRKSGNFFFFLCEVGGIIMQHIFLFHDNSMQPWHCTYSRFRCWIPNCFCCFLTISNLLAKKLSFSIFFSNSISGLKYSFVYVWRNFSSVLEFYPYSICLHIILIH